MNRMPVETAMVPFTANPVAKVPVKSVIAPKEKNDKHSIHR